MTQSSRGTEGSGAKAVDIAVFAHNEAAGIARMIEGLARQDLLRRADLSARVYILANGCSDDTITRARAALRDLPVSDRFEVMDFAEGGKSRTWNRFVHEVSRPESELLVLCDADIEIPCEDALSRLVETLVARPELAVANSRPVKDIAFRPEEAAGLDRLIAAGGGSLDDWRKAICGQLYAMRAGVARGIHLPIGLPVEDGFLRAMVLTGQFGRPEDFGAIDGTTEGVGEVFHVYASERGVGGLVRHQTRIVIGSAINFAVFAHLRGLPASSIPPALARAANDESWLPAVIRARLPVWPFGWVPVHFLTKRAAGILRNPGRMRPRTVAVLVVGFGLDLVVYALAQFKMARGTGAGHW